MQQFPSIPLDCRVQVGRERTGTPFPFFLPARRSKLRQRGWLGGWLSVCHSRYCIKTTKPILKLFQPSDSPVIEAFGTPYVDTKFQGNPFIGGYIYTGVGKIGDFRRKWPVSRKRCKIRTQDRTMVTMEG